MLTGKTIRLEISLASTTDDLKVFIQEAEGIPIDQQRLVYSGKEMADGRALKDYAIEAESTFHLCLRLRGGMMQVTSGRLDFAALSSLQTNLAVVPIGGGQDGDAPLLSMSITGASTARDVLKAVAQADHERMQQAAMEALVGELSELGAADVDSMPEEQLREMVRRAQAAAATGARGSKRQRKE
jgi:hypothetical protein